MRQWLMGMGGGIMAVGQVFASDITPLPAHTVTSGDIAVNLSQHGDIVSMTIGGTVRPIAGGTHLQGFRQVGETTVKTSILRHVCAFTKTVSDDQGHTARVTDRFSPTQDSIRWEVEIISDDKPWSTAIETWLNYPATRESRFWTTWGHPEQQGTWSDPLAWRPFADRTWLYQYTTWNEVLRGTDLSPLYLASGTPKDRSPSGSRFAIPLMTVAEPACDTAYSIVQSPEDTLLDLVLTETAKGGIRLSRLNHRLGGGKPVRFEMDVVAHPADSRAGLGWMVKRYPQFFDPGSPAAESLYGCAAYSGSEARFNTDSLRRMAFAYNWKCSEDFPYMGLFLPPMVDAKTGWKRAPDEKTPGKSPVTSCQQMNEYARWMKQQGFQVLSYFNVTEYGRCMPWPLAPSATLKESDYWMSPSNYLLRNNLVPAVLMNGTNPVRSNCYGALIVDPGDPGYQQHLLEQVRRHIKYLPDTAGIAIDRLDWLNRYNGNADDGVSWVNGKPARSLFVSWQQLMDQVVPELHRAGKVVVANNCTPRLEVVGRVDGIYAEWSLPSYFNHAALTGVRKPVALWTAQDKELTDDYMQRCLYLGIYPTAPYPNNNHCLRPSPRANAQFLAYGPLMDAMRGRKWVLEPHCAETATPNVKVNLFEVPGGYALPVSFGGTAEFATVTLRNMPGLANIKVCALHPGAETTAPVAATLKDGTLTLTVPLKRGCAMVKLSRQ